MKRTKVTAERELALILSVIMILTMSACNSKTDDSELGSDSVWPGTVTIATGNPGAVGYYIGAAQSQILSDTIEGVYFAAEATDGSFTTNAPLVQNNPDCMGLVVLSAMQDALKGEYSELEGMTLDKLRLVMVGHASTLQFVTLKETGITSLEEMKGKRIATASPGSAVRIATLQVLDALGYEESDFASITAMTASDMGDALRDGAIDIAVFNVGIPGAAVSDLNSTRDILMLEIPEDAMDKVLAENPTYRTYRVTSNEYSDLTEDVIVLGLPMGYACNADMDDDLVYEITKVLNASTEELAAIHAEGANWNTENSLSFYQDGSIPFHPGAARYYDEVLGN